MKKKYLFQIAFKNLWFRKVRTIVTILGMVVGVGAIVFLVSLGYGLQKMTLDHVGTMELLKTLDVYSEKSTIVKLNEGAVERIRDLGHVEAVAPLINLGGKIRYGEKETEGVIYGAERQFFELSEIKLIAGSGFTGDLGEVIVNASTLELLGVTNPEDILGETINSDLILTKSVAPKLKKEKQTVENLEFKVVGVSSAEETAGIYLPFFKMTSLGVENYQLSKVKVNSEDRVEQLRIQIENFGFRVDWVGDTIAQVNQVFDIFKVVLGAFGAIALLVSALGIFNTLTISLMERTREIGIMKVLGMGGKDVRSLFLIEAGLIGIVGGIIGVSIGYGAGALLNYLFHILAVRAQAEPVSIFYTPILFAILMGFFALLIGVITGIYPAVRAKRIKPLDALRYE